MRLLFIILLTGILFIAFNNPVLAASNSLDATAELMVIFKKDESPEKLQEKIIERNKFSSMSPWNSAKYLLHDSFLHFVRKGTTEEKLARIFQTEEQAGVVLRMPARSLYSESGDLYLIKIDQDHSVEFATVLYLSLPEVLNVEKNVILIETK